MPSGGGIAPNLSPDPQAKERDIGWTWIEIMKPQNPPLVAHTFSNYKITPTPKEQHLLILQNLLRQL